MENSTAIVLIATKNTNEIVSPDKFIHQMTSEEAAKYADYFWGPYEVAEFQHWQKNSQIIAPVEVTLDAVKRSFD